MLTSPTLDKLRDLNLLGMTRAYQEQMERADARRMAADEIHLQLVQAIERDRHFGELPRSPW